MASQHYKKRIVIDLGVLVLVAFVGWYLLLRPPTLQSVKGVEDIQLSVRYLWDPSSLDLPDWQIIGLARDIIISPSSELFVSDQQGKRVIRFTTNGELIEIIGREGDGPGEFRDPWDLFYFEPDSTLWVVDRGTVRGHISRFKVGETRSLYIDRFVTEYTWLQTTANLVVEDPHTFWVNDRRIHSTEDRRMLRLLDDGSVSRAFGDIWVHPDIKTERDRGMLGTYNVGCPLLTGRDRIVFVFQMRPVMEVWSTDGELMLEREFDFPEIKVRQKYYAKLKAPERGSSMVGAPIAIYLYTPEWCEARESIFVVSHSMDPNRTLIYEISTYDLSLKNRYVVDPSDEDIGVHGLAVECSDNGFRIYSTNPRNSGIFVLEPDTG